MAVSSRWRTALIIRELEQEIAALARGRPHREKLKQLMTKKEIVGDMFNQLRLARQRALAGRQLGMGHHAETDGKCQQQPGRSVETKSPCTLGP